MNFVLTGETTEEQKKKHLLALAAFSILALIFFAVTVVATVSAIKDVGEVFPGFRVNPRLMVGAANQPHWTGMQAGLTPRHKILQANGVELQSKRDLQQLIEKLEPGVPVAYIVEKEGRRTESLVPTMRFTWNDLVVTFFVYFSAALFYGFIGIVVFMLKPNKKQSWTFFLACFFLGIFSVAAHDLSAPISRLISLYFFAAGLVPAAFIHFSFYFPTQNRLVQQHRILEFVPYVVSSILVLGLEVLYPQDEALVFWDLVLLYMAGAVIFLVYPIVKQYFRSTSILDRQRAKIVLLGAVLAFPISTSLFLAQGVMGGLFDFPLPTNFLTLPLLVFPTAIAYAIVKHNLFDVDTLVKRAVGYGIMTAVVATSYFVLQTLVTEFVLQPLLGSVAENAYAIFFALLVVFFFDPVNRRVQYLVQKFFFRAEYDYKEILSAVEIALSTTLDLKQIASRIIQPIREEMFIDLAGVVILQQAGAQCLPLFESDYEAETNTPVSQICIEPEDPLIQLFDEERRLVTKYDIEEDARYQGMRKACRYTFDALRATMGYPMIAHERLVGILFTGTKKSGKFYTREDVDLLQSLSTHGAVAIDHARLKGIKGTFSQYLAPAVIEELIAHPEKLTLGGEKREVTALFSDLAGFTTIAESLEPEELVHLLNQYFNEACDAVLHYGGTIDKIVGDALHVLFNAPVDQPDHAERAVRCALELRDCGQHLIEARQGAHDAAVGHTRVGVNTGSAVVGNFGGSARFDYTAHGDAINTAARLEGANKYLGTWVCVSAETKAQCTGLAFRPIGRIILKGKSEPVEVYEPLLPSQAEDGGTAGYLAAYQLMARDDPRAMDAFVALAKRFPQDGLIRVHAGRLLAGDTGNIIRLLGK
jgi:class 3 adenylate cyclase